MTGILSKIKKLLALSKSPNPNEAASALRRAQELMEEYGIDKESITQADIIEEEISRAGGKRPPKYEMYLISEICRAFGVTHVHRTGWDERRWRPASWWRFIGAENRVEIATFMATVLLRKCAAARAEYLKTLYRCKRDTKVKRADEHCLGWVSVIAQKLKTFTGSAEDVAALNAYMKKYEDCGKVKPISREAPKRFEWQDYSTGRAAADGVELQHGVGGKKDDRRLLASG